MTDSAASRNATAWSALFARLLPFADSATRELPLPRLLRLSLFQVSVGMATVLLTGTLNRVMIVELGIPAWLVAVMVALPLVFAPLRALIGFKSDTHRSAIGWRRGPYIWFGSMLQFGGFAIMPFALLILSGDAQIPTVAGHIGAALAFLLVGLGMHTTQTAGLALATDLAPENARSRVVALLYVMFLAGMLISALLIGALLADFSALRLIQVIQGAAVVTMALNMIALWKQEARNSTLTDPRLERPSFQSRWRGFRATPGAMRLLTAVGFGAAAFSMQDVLLEPYGGEVLGLSVGATTALTAIWAAGMLAGFAFAAFTLGRAGEPHRLAGTGLLAGAVGFVFMLLSGPMAAPLLFSVSVALIGFGGGLFAVGTLSAAMAIADVNQAGLALGAWGAVQATAGGAAIAFGGAARDVMGSLGVAGVLGPALMDRSVGYSFVYVIEIVLLFAALAAIGPLARFRGVSPKPVAKFGLAEFPS
jgi:BCD family chlorophyll transporter-like MFS transporter